MNCTTSCCPFPKARRKNENWLWRCPDCRTVWSLQRERGMPLTPPKWRLVRSFTDDRSPLGAPTPTADAWRRLADVQPDDGEMCWWWIDGMPGDPWRIAAGRYGTSIWAPETLWQPVPKSVIPPHPRGREDNR